jgi:uncharacterized SAM-binding protein YcdF (DUF218 family)
MNDIVLALGLETWKPILTTLVLPPVPFLVVLLLAGRQIRKRPPLGWLMLVLSVICIWLSCTEAMAHFLIRNVMRPPLALSSSEIIELKRSPKTAIVVLGGGRRLVAPEYGVSSLKPRTLERLRFGIWLSRETGLPLAFSGGVGYGAEPGASEAEVAGRIAEKEFGRPLRWQEGLSRDTRENAIKTIAMLEPQGIEKIVLVTHGYHIRRAVGNFERAAEGTRITIVAAPINVARYTPLRALDWMPSVDGFEDTWIALRELLGRLIGA